MNRLTEKVLTLATFLTIAVTTAGCGRNLFSMLTGNASLGICGTIIAVLDILALLEIAGSRRTTGNKLLLAALIIFFPLFGVLIYYFFVRDKR